MRRWLRLALPAAIALVALPASAAGLRITAGGGAWKLVGQEKLQVWANSAEAGVTVDNNGRGFLNLELTFDNILAGSIVTTPEGVLMGTSRDGSPVTGAANLGPADRQEWKLRPNMGSAYRFAVVGGTRGGRPGQGTYGAISRDMAAKGMTFAIHMGDAVTNGNKKQIEDFREQLRSFKFPTYVVPGNHEVAGGGRKAWQQLFGTMPVAFGIGPDRFILLDNAAGKLDRNQENWLLGVLAREERARRLFVFLHRPLVDARPGINQGMTDIVQVRRLLKVFKEHNVSAVFAGHIPMYARERRHGVTYVTTAGGGEAPVVPAARGGYHHWVRVDVDAGGAVAIAPVKIGGEFNNR